MNDHELDLALADFGATRVRESAPPELRERVRASVLEPPGVRGWWQTLVWRYRSMFSALKFVAAAVIVALFGGFLLSGVLNGPGPEEQIPAAVTASPSATTTQTTPPEVAPTAEPESTPEATPEAIAPIRSDMVLAADLLTREIEPGILQVIGDGIEQLPEVSEYGYDPTLRIGLDGSAWALADGHFRRLGEAERHAWPKDGRPGTFEVTPDGTVWGFWALSDGQEKSWRVVTRSFDGTSWTKRAEAPSRRFREPDLDYWIDGPGRTVKATAIAPDGTLWTTWPDTQDRFGRRTFVARLGPDGWEPVGSPIEFDECCAADLTITEDGDVWAIGEGRRIYRLTDGDWQEQQLPASFPYVTRIGPDGTAWHFTLQPRQVDGACVLSPDGDPLTALVAAAFDGDVVQAWDWELTGDDVFEQVGQVDPAVWRFEVEVRIAPDGSLWIAELVHSYAEDWMPGGVVRFDGATWQHFLPGLIVQSLDIAADGTVWLSGSPGADGAGRYAIDPDVAVPGDVRPVTPTTLRPRVPGTGSEPTTPPSTAVRTDILPGVELATVEVEPGVLRVENDGVLDLEWPGNAWTRLIGGRDGSLWVDVPKRLRRIGEASKGVKLPDSKEQILSEVAPDGTVWAITQRPPSIQSFDGKRWTTWMLSGTRNPKAIEVAPDGTVWAMWLERKSTDEEWDQTSQAVFGYLDGDRWRRVGRFSQRDGTLKKANAGALVITDDGVLWGRHCGDGCSWSRFLDGSWKETVPANMSGAKIVGPDGTVWVVDKKALGDRDHEGPFLRRFDGTEWQAWDVGEGIPDAADWDTVFDVTVSPDGALWMRPWGTLIDEDCWGRRDTDGIVRFDGNSADHFLRDHRIDSLAFSPDGSAWALAAGMDGDRRHLYVVTPEAATAE